MVERATLPPPPPPSPPKEADPVRWSHVAPVLAVVAIVSTAVMTVLWLSARDEADQARLEADRSIALAAEAESSEEEARVELEAAIEELADAGGSPDAGAAADEAAADEAAISALQEEVERLAAENASLNEDLAELREGAASDADEPESTTTTSTTTTTESPAPEPEDPPIDIGIDLANPQAVGQFLGNLYRDSVLGSGQETCIGESVTSELGDQLASILGSADPGADDDLVTALENATDTCSIDRTAIFG